MVLMIMGAALFGYACLQYGQYRGFRSGLLFAENVVNEEIEKKKSPDS